MTEFPHRVKVGLRYGDTDRQGHVNNAVFATFCESGRVGLVHDADANMPPQGTHFVLAQITINYLAEVFFPGEVEVCSRVSHIGNSSIRIEQEILNNGTVCAKADNVIVLADKETRKSCPLPVDARAFLERFSGQ